MPNILVCDEIVGLEDEVLLQDKLRQHYGAFSGKPVMCLCTELRVRMYIARISDRYVLKRWPGSGYEHSVECDRYEPPSEASGLGALLGSAIREDMSTGEVELRLGFPLKKQPRKAGKKGGDKDEAGAPDEQAGPSSGRVGLRAMLHYLWDQAELTHWRPGMKGKRNWRVIHRRLIDAAGRMVVKGRRLGARLFVPEPFRTEAKDEIRLRRRAFFQTIASAKSARDLIVFIAEIKELAPSPYGYKLVAKNVPDDPLYLSGELYKTLRRRFETELEMFEQGDGAGHLIALGTVSVKPSGTVTIEDLVLMATTNEWIPVADGREAVIVDYSVATGRRFVKPMKYNMGAGRTLAAVLFTDSPGKPTALYVVKPDDSEAVVKAREDLLQSPATTAVLWKIAEDPIPTTVIDGIGTAVR